MMSDEYLKELDQKRDEYFEIIDRVRPQFPYHDHELVEEWIEDLRKRGETPDEKMKRNEFLERMVHMLTKEKEIIVPFVYEPPINGPLPTLRFYDSSVIKGGKKLSFTLKKMPPPKKKAVSGTGKQKKKEKPVVKPRKNMFEDTTEIARVIAKSKGLEFSDFVAAVAKYTEDYGEALRSAMRIEVTEFRDYVNKVIDRRIKDLRKGMDEECNFESERIKKDIEKWKNELANVKREVLDMIPDFDMDEFKTDRHYLTKIFSFDVQDPRNVSAFNNWKEESCIRLKWYNDNANKLAQCNQQLQDDIKCMKDQTVELQNEDAIKSQTSFLEYSTATRQCVKINQEIDAVNAEINDLNRKLSSYRTPT